MRQKYVMGNWKMHGNHASIDALLSALKSLPSNPTSTIVVFPAYPYLEKAHEQLKGAAIKLGAQDVSAYSNGAYTGDVSAAMLKDVGCQYVLIGHSERRHLMGEGEDIIGEKFRQALEHQLIPVLCVGETKEQRQQQQTEQIVLAQLQNVLNLSVEKLQLMTMIVAYEPVWAIGTGLTATPEQAQEVHQLLRKKLKTAAKALADIPIVYGGSVKADNAQALFDMPDIDGALVGGASLDSKAFREICAVI